MFFVTLNASNQTWCKSPLIKNIIVARQCSKRRKLTLQSYSITEIHALVLFNLGKLCLINVNRKSLANSHFSFSQSSPVYFEFQRYLAQQLVSAFKRWLKRFFRLLIWNYIMRHKRFSWLSDYSKSHNEYFISRLSRVAKRLFSSFWQHAIKVWCPNSLFVLFLEDLYLNWIVFSFI